MSEPAPFPSPPVAGLLTFLGVALTLFAWMLLLPDAGHALALALGLCLGLGGVATLAARAVPASADLGLRGFSPRFLVPIALLLPSLVLSSELDNVVRPRFPAPPAPEGAEPSDPAALRLAAVEFAIVTALLRPVVEEFHFRAVVQQGAVAQLGAAAGVLYTALLSGLAAGALGLPFGAGYAASSGVQAAFTGLLLGLVRQATGSVLAAMVTACLLRGLAIASVLLFAEALPIPGFNAPGAHTPGGVLAASAAAVALGVALLVRRGRPA